MVTSGILGGEMVITQVQNARNVGSIDALGTIFPIFTSQSFPLKKVLHKVVLIMTVVLLVTNRGCMCGRK